MSKPDENQEEVIEIPYRFTPRSYQKSVFEARDKGFKRFVAVWHRRAGKDKTGINFMAREMLKRPGIYYYMFPEYAQGRKIMWEGIDKDGFRFIDHIPPFMRGRINNQEMMIELKPELGGSIFRVVGADKVDRIVGTNPVGLVYSEYSLMNPAAWQLFRPILAENGGWAYFDFTPRGKNHAYHLYEMAKKNPEWFCSRLTVEDTGAIPLEEIERERREGTPEEIVQQEYYVSFASGMSGAIYAKHVEAARNRGRIGTYKYDESKPVSTFWDLGYDDYTTIGFRQKDGNSLIWIDCIHDRGKTLEDYVKMLRDTGFYFDVHVMPHDAAKGNIQTGKKVFERFEELLREYKVPGYVDVVPRGDPETGISAVKSRFGRYCFDAEGCGDDIEQSKASGEGGGFNPLAEGNMSDHGLIPALMDYHRKWNPELQNYGKPVHNWASHFCDMLRTEAMYDDDYVADGDNDSGIIEPRVITDYDPFGGY